MGAFVPHQYTFNDACRSCMFALLHKYLDNVQAKVEICRDEKKQVFHGNLTLSFLNALPQHPDHVYTITTQPVCAKRLTIAAMPKYNPDAITDFEEEHYAEMTVDDDRLKALIHHVQADVQMALKYADRGFVLPLRPIMFNGAPTSYSCKARKWACYQLGSALSKHISHMYVCRRLNSIFLVLDSEHVIVIEPSLSKVDMTLPMLNLETGFTMVDNVVQASSLVGGDNESDPNQQQSLLTTYYQPWNEMFKKWQARLWNPVDKAVAADDPHVLPSWYRHILV